MRKKRPFLLFWLIVFFILLLLSSVFFGKLSIDLSQINTEKIVSSKSSIDKFKKEFLTYWWKDYKFAADYDKGELKIYLPKQKGNNQFINIEDVLSAVSMRQYQYGDKNLIVLILTSDRKNLARLKNGKVIASYSDKVNKKVVKKRLNEWKKINEKVKQALKSTESSITNSSKTGESISNYGR